MTRPSPIHLTFHRHSLLQLASLFAHAAQCERDAARSARLAHSSVEKANLAIELGRIDSVHPRAIPPLVTRIVGRYGPPRTNAEARALLVCSVALMSRVIFRDIPLAQDSRCRRTLTSALSSLRADITLIHPDAVRGTPFSKRIAPGRRYPIPTAKVSSSPTGHR